MNIMIGKEEWKEIEECHDYEVSNYGHLRRKKTGRIMKQCFCGAYLGARLAKKARTTHRLVAKAFLKNPEDKRTVNHKNGIKSDNRLCNLEWATHKENLDHANDIGLSSKQTPLVRDDTGEEFRTLKEASGSIGVPYQWIQKHLRGELSHVKGTTWSKQE